MIEATVDEVDEVDEVAGIRGTGYSDWRGLEAELQALVRSKTPESSPSPGIWAKRRRKV